MTNTTNMTPAALSETVYQRKVREHCHSDVELVATRMNDLGRVELSWWLRGLNDCLFSGADAPIQNEGEDLYWHVYLAGWKAAENA